MEGDRSDQRPGGSIRTGVRSDEVFKIETHGIDEIPLNDRHGSPRELFWIWMGSNLIFTYVIFGAILVSFGIPLWAAILAVVLGNLLYVPVAVGGIPGPRTGTSTLAVSRAAFGPLGNIPSCLAQWFNIVGFAAVNAVVGTLALQQLAVKAGLHEGTPLKAVSLAIVLGLTFVVAILGHATVVVIQRWFTYGLAAGSVLLAIFVLPKLDIGAISAIPPAADTTFSAFLLAFFLVASGPLSYIASPADFTRYLPAKTRGAPITLWTAIGAFIPAVGLALVGIAAGTATDMTDSVAGIGNIVPSWFFVPFLAVIVGGTITNNIVGLYSSGLDLQVMGVKLPRARTVLIDAAVATALSVYALFVSDFTSTFVAFLSLVVIWMAPWGAIYLVDIWLRRNAYDTVGLHQGRGGPYWYTAGFNVRGLAALALGVTGAALFANSTKFRGPLVGAIGGGDLSVVIGMLVAAVAYYVLMAPIIRAQSAAPPVPRPAEVLDRGVEGV